LTSNFLNGEKLRTRQGSDTIDPMPVAQATLSEIRDTRLEPGGPSASLACAQSLQPGPGQYLLAASHNPDEVLPTPLFPASLPGEELALASAIPSTWTAGTRLVVRGPLGNGFSLPRSARSVALAALDCTAALLLPLAHLALAQGAAVTILSSQAPAGLPSAVEILSLEQLPETIAWADYLAAAFPLTSLEKFRRTAGVKIHQRLNIPAQALLLTALPCGNLAGCGLCAVPTPHGWKLACTDGPVFDLNTLELP
jgi:NAD(P)H-flavin reductase